MFVGGAVVVGVETVLVAVLLAGVTGEPQSSTAELSITRIHEKVKIFQVKKKRLPTSLAEVYAGEFEPRDPWGNRFVMQASVGASGYDIVSYGADGKVGGKGGDADIRLSDLD
jgi:general secretion pathway protein G